MTAGLKRDDEAGSVVRGPGQHSVVGAQRIGPYRLIQPLGEGGMGVVHLALDPNGRAVAIKVLREHIAHDREARDRLRREVETLALVQDPRVAAILDADTEGPRPYIVTRYIPGPALDRVVFEDGPLEGEALLRLGRGLWYALNAIHGAGVIHRDLKPANVVLLDGDPVVIDFGIAHVADDIRLTMTGLVMGTPG
ncbi:MAG TPA: serine/threonine-protein kinase, partial [Dermatophilaceae bacterium]|nr:serine/threonine-protein kinase [Dermatophilaceae bacterium]